MALNSLGDQRLRWTESSMCLEAHSVSDLKEKGNEEISITRDQPHSDVPTSVCPGAHTDEDEKTIIMDIRETDTALGYGRTKSIPVSVNSEPSDLSVVIDLARHASLEFQPIAAAVEERLRELTIIVKKIPGRSVKNLLSTFPMDGNAISLCPPLSVTARQQERNSSDSIVLRIHDSCCATTEVLEDTNQDDSALLRYQKRREGWNPESSIQQFECALNVCLRRLCRAAAHSNSETANFVHCQLDDIDPFLDVPLELHSNALVARPINHLNRPLTLLQLTLVHLAVSGKHWDEAGTAWARLLPEALRLCSLESWECRVAISMLQAHGCTMDSAQAVDGSSLEHDSSTSSSLTDLVPWISGIQLLHRFKRLGDLADLQQTISNLEASIRDASASDHHYIVGVAYLGLAFLCRFDHLGAPSDLDQAILRFENAVVLIPDGHPDKPACLNNLGIAFKARFEHLGELSDLEQAILRLEDAVDLTPHGSPRKLGPLNNLGNAFSARFERLGKLSDLEKAISRKRDAVESTPHGHLHKPAFLNSLGASLLTRFERLGELSDLEQGMSRFRDAVDLTPDGHTKKSIRLNNLGNSFKTRFKRFGNPRDLEEAISSQRNAVDLTPHGHFHKPTLLNNLATSLFTRFECLGELSDLEQAISKLEDAVGLIPHGHPGRPTCLNNLASSIRARFECLGMLNDLEQAISSQRDAIDFTPDSHPDRPGYLSNLGNTFVARFHRLGESSDLEQAISQYSRAAHASSGPTTVRFHASQAWISCARILRHHSLLHAYSVAIGLLPQLAWIGLSLADRYRRLIGGADVVREAVAAAVDSGHFKTAVEWLEQGRSIVWGELFQLRSSYDELSCAYPDHAFRLRELSAALEHASATREKSLSSLSEQTQSVAHHAMGFMQKDADRHRTLAIERDKLLQDIRGFPGFERFLLHKEYFQLRASAHSGPIVILNAAEIRCDALMILADVEDVLHVPLPNFSLRRCKGLQNAVKNLLGPARIIRCDERAGRRVSWMQASWESLLSILWNDVVKPVLDVLGFSNPGDHSRIFWCPTGPFAFLPIHAAGLYGTQFSEPGNKASDFVVSSYIPTLSVLDIQPKSDTSSTSSGGLNILAVRQPSTDGQFQLPGVDVEVEHIKAAIRYSPSARITLTEPAVGTVEEVLALMKSADWVHFACHGVQDAASPTESGLCLADRRRLKLSDTISLSERPRGGLAFLSACQTAMGDQTLSDEAIHIAAGMLFAGYGGVIGTMWSISDKLAPTVARDVYGQLFRGCTTPDYREAARALHGAVERLRDSEASFVEWLPFIHVGL